MITINYFGKSGQTKYFHIIKKEALYFEVHSNWDVYEKDFINWHEGDSISIIFIKFGFWPGKRDTNSWIQINRETGKMSWISATEDHKNSHWYEADCDKINYNDLPVKKVKQKF